MNSKALLSTSALRRACTLVIVLFVAILTTNAQALPEPKVTITYSLKTEDGGAYWQDISGTPLGAGDVEFVFDTDDSTEPRVNVTRADPLTVTIEYTADSPGGNIVDGPVELTQTDFGRDFILTTTILGQSGDVTTIIDTQLSQIGTGTLSGSTITWDSDTYTETVGPGSYSDCAGAALICDLGAPEPDGWPRDLDAVDRPVVLPTFTLFTNDFFGDEFASDNGTPNDASDDIPRPDEDATVRETWYGVVPEPSGETLLLAGVLGLAGLHRLRERGGASA